MTCCPRVVLLDFDGTVIDTMRLYTVEAARLISMYTGMSLEEAETLYRNTAGMSFRRQLEEAGLRGGKVEEVARRFEEWKRSLLSRLRLNKRVVEAVSSMKDLGFKVYLSTNNECSVISGLGLDRVFDGVLCNEPGRGFEKGEPHLREVMRREGVEACSIVFIGDSDYDIRLYRGLGVRVIRTSGLWRDESIIRRLAGLKEDCKGEYAH